MPQEAFVGGRPVSPPVNNIHTICCSTTLLMDLKHLESKKPQQYYFHS